MEYRALGRTGLKVSALSYGASSIGGGVFGPVEEAGGIRAVRTALELGVNLIDVAPFYGLTRAEAVLGKALAGVPRDTYALATKVGRYGDRDFDFSTDRITRGLEDSLERLGVDYVDILQCHDIEFAETSQILHETLPTLFRLRDAGKTRFVGITGLPLKVFPAVIDQTPVDTIISYCHYALNDTSLEELLPYLRGKGVGVMSAAPLSMGLLSGKPLPDWHPAPAAVRSACAEAAAHCAASGTPIAQLAVQFAVANPRIATTIIGSPDPAEIRRNVEWVQSPPDPTLLEVVMQILAPAHNVTWPSGRPENN